MSCRIWLFLVGFVPTKILFFFFFTFWGTQRSLFLIMCNSWLLHRKIQEGQCVYKVVQKIQFCELSYFTTQIWSVISHCDDKKNFFCQTIAVLVFNIHNNFNNLCNPKSTFYSHSKCSGYVMSLGKMAVFHLRLFTTR